MARLGRCGLVPGDATHGPWGAGGTGAHPVGFLAVGQKDVDLTVSVHFRAVPRSADDSRHQDGEAADEALDANGDGRIDGADISAIVQAVEVVEAAHPELTGGLDIYTSRRYPTPYVHIDIRGEARRWHG